MNEHLPLVDYREDWGAWTGPHWLVRKSARFAWIQRTTAQRKPEKVAAVRTRPHEETR